MATTCPRMNRTACRVQGTHTVHVGYRNGGRGKGKIATQRVEWTAADLAPKTCFACGKPSTCGGLTRVQTGTYAYEGHYEFWAGCEEHRGPDHRDARVVA